jgi:hypothetical protein
MQTDEQQMLRVALGSSKQLDANEMRVGPPSSSTPSAADVGTLPVSIADVGIKPAR